MMMYLTMLICTAVFPYRVGTDLWISNGDVGFVIIGTSRGVSSHSGFRSMNWVAAWNGFAVVNDDGIWSIGADGKRTYRSTQLPDTDQAAISPDGTIYCEVEQEYSKPARVVVKPLRGGKEIVRIEPQEFVRHFGPVPELEPHPTGVAWHSSGRLVAFGHGYGTKWDGDIMAPSQCGILDLSTKKLISIGEGAPIAWINDFEILCQTRGGDYVIRDRRNKRGKRIGSTPDQFTFDGREFLRFVKAGDRIALIRLDRNLKRLSKQLLPPFVRYVDINDGLFAGRH